jgi:hypothetical protein
VQSFCFVITIKSFRILAQTWVKEAFCALAEGLPSNRNLCCRDGNGNRTSSILWHSPVSLFFKLILIIACCRIIVMTYDNKKAALCQENFCGFLIFKISFHEEKNEASAADHHREGLKRIEGDCVPKCQENIRYPFPPESPTADPVIPSQFICVPHNRTGCPILMFYPRFLENLTP